jgi:DNA gyrase/topoisomerase IV subunit B
LEQLKKTEEASAEAKELRQRVKELEEQRNKGLVEANSGQISDFQLHTHQRSILTRFLAVKAFSQ